MAKVDFDKVIQRKKTDSVKYDGLQNYFGVNDVQPLWVADMDFAAPKFVQKALKKKIKQEAYGYELLSSQFYESVIWWQKRYKLALSKEDILFCAGVVPALKAVVEALSQENDEVIIQPPVYFPFFSVIKQANRKLVTNPLKKSTTGKYKMDLEDLERKISPATKLLILCSPHNPVGRVWSQKELQKLHLICKKHNITVVSDEIHSDIVYKPFVSYMSVDVDAVVLNAPSKTFNVAGFHTAYTLCKNKTLQEKIKNQYQKRHLVSLNTLSNTLVQSCYSKKGQKWLDALLEYLQQNREFVKKFVKTRVLDISVSPCEGTYLLWLDFSNTGLTHKQIHHKLLYDAKVALNDGLTFGKNGKYFFRLNIALPQSELYKALSKIANAFGK